MTRDGRVVDMVAGARPNFMKVGPVIRAMEMQHRQDGLLDYRLLRAGQHYDSRMSGEFFRQLGNPEAHVNLEVGSGTQADQTAALMTRFESLLLKFRSDMCLVVGDVTSTMACAITAQKLCIPVGLVEGGIRSGDWTIPEEINRLVTDSVTNWFFTTTEGAKGNWHNSGVAESLITTERPETVTIGTNELVGTEPSAIKAAVERLPSGNLKRGGIPEKWDGLAGERIVGHPEQLLV